jgi:hypothetical protein
MERRLLSVLGLRALLLAAPFIGYFAWRAWARGRGLAPGPTPYVWLFVAGCLLMGASLLATAAFRHDNRDRVYVPAETAPDGTVRQGYFRPKRAEDDR